MPRWWVDFVRKVMNLPPLQDGERQPVPGVYRPDMTEAVTLGIILHESS